MDECAAISPEPDFASQNNLSVQGTREVLGKNLPTCCIGNKGGKRAIDQQLLLDPQQLRPGMIYLAYLPLRIKGEIGDRCEIVQLSILVS